jgi:hypothetical protein
MMCDGRHSLVDIHHMFDAMNRKRSGNKQAEVDQVDTFLTKLGRLNFIQFVSRKRPTKGKTFNLNTTHISYRAPRVSKVWSDKVGTSEFLIEI